MRGEIRRFRRIAGKPRPGNAILHDVEGVDHDRGDALAVQRCRKNSRLMVRSGEKKSSKAAFRRRHFDDRLGRADGRPVREDGGAVCKYVAREIGGDHDFRSQRTRGRNRHRIDQWRHPPASDRPPEPARKFPAAHREARIASTMRPLREPYFVDRSGLRSRRWRISVATVSISIFPIAASSPAASLSPPIRPEPSRRISR